MTVRQFIAEMLQYPNLDAEINFKVNVVNTDNAELDIPVEIDFMCLSSYGKGSASSGVVKIVKDLNDPIEGKNVLIIEDILDSGNTLSHLVKLLGTRNPKSVRIATLLDKPDRRVAHVDVAYKGFSIPDEFVVGYGLDYDQRYRNLPYIGVVEFED